MRTYEFVLLYFKCSAQKDSLFSLDASARLYIREILVGKKIPASIAIKTGNNTYYINPNSIVYVQSNRHRTTLYCIDKVIDSSMSIREIAKLLPSSFHQIRRGCLINAIYITRIKRCEVELVFKTIIPIPVPKFSQIKEELEIKIAASNSYKSDPQN